MNSVVIDSYIRNGLPPNLAARYHVENGNIVNNISGLILAPEDKIKDIIAAFKKDPGTSGGRDRLYGFIREKYSNITRREVAEYLAGDSTHQIHKPLPKRVTTKPIIPTGAAKIAQIDLIDMSKYSGYNNHVRYVLTYIDCFAKWVAARPMTNKQQPTVVKALADILDSMPPAWRPSVLQSDNGSEFMSQMNAMLEARDIKHVYSQAYNPTSQGIIERFNRTLKSTIFEYMTENKTYRYIDVLPAIITKLNTTKHGTTNYKPIELMEAEATPELIAYVRARMLRRSQQNSAVQNPVEYKVGDYVRVAVTTESSVRKQTFRKRIGANWSLTIFQIYKISEPENSGTQPQFLLKNMDTNRKSKKLYWGWQLQRATYDPVAAAEERKEEVEAAAPGHDGDVDEEAPAPLPPAPPRRTGRAREPSAAALRQIAADEDEWEKW
jgi:transposase InsO family protein